MIIDTTQTRIERSIQDRNEWSDFYKSCAEKLWFSPIHTPQHWRIRILRRNLLDQSWRKEISPSSKPELKDLTLYQQVLLHMHSVSLISTKTLFKELGLDYEKELALVRKLQREGGQNGYGSTKIS